MFSNSEGETSVTVTLNKLKCLHSHVALVYGLKTEDKVGWTKTCQRVKTFRRRGGTLQRMMMVSGKAVSVNNNQSSSMPQQKRDRDHPVHFQQSLYVCTHVCVSAGSKITKQRLPNFIFVH